MGCIYKFQFPSDKVYIGKAISFKKRLAVHKRKARKVHTRLYCAIRKYGWDQISIEIIEDEIPKEFLNDRERFWIGYYQASQPSKGYNMTLGGDGGNTFSAAKIRATLIRKGIRPPIHHNGNGGYKLTDADKQKLSKARLGRSYEDILGVERATSLKQEKRKRWIGAGNPRYKEVDLKSLAQAVVEKPEMTSKEAGELFQVSKVTIFNKLEIPWTKWKQEVINERNKEGLSNDKDNQIG
jgi:group I intron endonuclease